MRYCKDDQIDRYVHDLVDEGWIFWRAAKHGRIRSPFGKAITVPTTPSDRRASKNFIAEAKRLVRSAYRE